jgi:cytochrome P450
MELTQSKSELNLSVAPRPRRPGGHLHEFSNDRLNFLTRTARELGDLVELDFAGVPVYLASDPAAIEEILITKNRAFRKGRGLGRTRRILGNGLLTSEGDFWRRQRRLAQPAFHHQRIQAYGEVMSEYTRRMLATWQDGQHLNIHAEMMGLTLAIATRTLFGEDISPEDTLDVRKSLEVGLHHFTSQDSLFFLPEWVPTPENVRFERAARRLDEVVYRIIAQHRARQEQTDNLLDMLLAARDEDGSQMTDRQLRDEVMTIFLAGHETTAVALSWTWLLLAQNPQVEARLHEEIDRVLRDRLPETKDLPNLSYTSQIVTEAMRLYPPAYVIARQAAQDVEIGGVRLPAGSTFIMSQWVVHHDPRWFEDPERFYPERWENDFAKRIPDFAYFPFGGGPRMCIGKPFALQEAALVLAAIARQYHLDLDPGQKIVPQPSLTLRPRGGIHVRLQKR